MSEFVTKDSGERQQFTSGMQRDTQNGKTLFHLVYDGPLLKRWAELLTRGAAKYSEGNWMKANGPEELKRFKASAARHFFQWYNDETDEDHAAAVTFNINGAEYVKGKVPTTPVPGRYSSTVTEGTYTLTTGGNVYFYDGVGDNLVPNSQFLKDFEGGKLKLIAPTKIGFELLNAPDEKQPPLTVEQSNEIADRVLGRAQKVNKAQPEEVIIPDRLHAALTQDAFIQNRPYYDETYTTSADATAPSLSLDSLVKLQDQIKDRILYNAGETKVGIDLASDDADRIVYLVGEPGKQVFVVPAELQEEFEKATIARNNETVPVNEDTLNLLRFNGFPLVYAPNLGASPLDRKPAFNGVTTTYRLDLPDEPTPFIDLIRQRIFEARLDLAQRIEASIWDMPEYEWSCSGDQPFNFFQRLLIKLQDFYQDLKTKLAEKLLDIATDLDPYVVGSGK